MLRFDASPAKSESSSASNTNDTSSSTQTVSSLVHHDFAYSQPPKSSAKDVVDRAQSHRDESPAPNEESSEDEYYDGFNPWPKPKPGYTRRLIPKVRISLEDIEENFDEVAFYKKAYPNLQIVDVRNVPEGWILVNGITLA